MHSSFRSGAFSHGHGRVQRPVEVRRLRASAMSAPDEADARRTFDALADGGKIEMPLAKTFWSPCFGMLTDRFGVEWMVMVPGTPA